MKKLKAGSLQLITFIIVVIALLLSAFIVLIHVHQQFRLKTNHTIETVAIVNRGISKVLYNKVTLNDTVLINLKDEDYKSLNVHRSFWGSFEMIHSKAKIKHTILKKTALVGSKNTTALCLKDNHKPLVLVGNTKIKGKAFLPQRGVKSGNISGQSYYGNRFVYGNIYVTKRFPTLSRELLRHLENIKVNQYLPDKANYINFDKSKRYSNSFESAVQIIYSTSDIFLSDVSITGHIIVQSDTKIVVSASATLTDIILIAPTIDIKSNVTGAFQAIATEKISVNERVNLSYPSALVLQNDYKRDESSDSKAIFLEDKSKVSGHIIAIGTTQTNNYDAQLKISANAVVEGSVYCEQNLELRGTVYGSVYTNNFIIKEGGSIYQNHLYNAIIDGDEIVSEFVGLEIDKADKKEIMKWLY